MNTCLDSAGPVEETGARIRNLLEELSEKPEELRRRSPELDGHLKVLREQGLSRDEKPRDAANRAAEELALWILEKVIPEAGHMKLLFLARSGILNSLAEIIKYNGSRPRRREEFRELIRRLLPRARGEEADSAFGIIAQAVPFAGSSGEDIRYRMYSRLHSLSPRTVFFAVMNGILLPERGTIDYLETLARGTPPGEAEKLSLGNPVYVLTLLYTYGFIHKLDTSTFSGEKYPMLNLIAEPEKFYFSNFRGHWWPFLNILRIQNVLTENSRKMGIVRMKLQNYLTLCDDEEQRKIHRILQGTAGASERY